MAETHLDHPGEVTWYAGKGPKTPLGLACDHPCDHNWTCAVIAWGPDFEHYTLSECSECGCRSWAAEYPPPHSPDRPKHCYQGFVQVAGKPSPDMGGRYVTGDGRD